MGIGCNYATFLLLSKWPPGASPNIRSERPRMFEAIQPRTRTRIGRPRGCPPRALVYFHRGTTWKNDEVSL